MTAGTVLLTVSGYIWQQLSGFTSTGSSKSVFVVDRCIGSLHPDPGDMLSVVKGIFTGFSCRSGLVRDELTDDSGYHHEGFLVSAGWLLVFCAIIQGFERLGLPK